MKLYKQTIKGFMNDLTIHICEIQVGKDTFIGQSAVSALRAKEQALEDAKPFYNSQQLAQATSPVLYLVD